MLLQINICDFPYTIRIQIKLKLVLAILISEGRISDNKIFFKKRKGSFKNDILFFFTFYLEFTKKSRAI